MLNKINTKRHCFNKMTRDSHIFNRLKSATKKQIQVGQQCMTEGSQTLNRPQSATNNQHYQKTNKGQTTAILLLLFIVFFLLIIIFLFQVAQTISGNEYENFYVTNTLVTIMRADTGYDDADCKLISDAIACSFLKPGWKCGKTGPTCSDLANEQVSKYINDLRKNYKLLFVAEPGWKMHGEEIRIYTDDDSDIDKERNKITADETIQRTVNAQLRKINVILYMIK